jgi:hypothetical protein
MDSLSVSHRRVDSWLASGDTALSPLTPPPDDVPKSRQGTLKRKRATSLPSNMPTSHSQRSDSPKRRRTDDEDVGPEQSASQLGSEASLTLNRTNTFSPPASRVSSGLKRSQSPTRETPIILRSAQPPIWTESLNGLKEHPPENVDRLGDYLAKDVDFGFIPQGLQVCPSDQMLSTYSNVCLAYHRERSRGGPPKDQADGLRPRRYALV